MKDEREPSAENEAPEEVEQVSEQAIELAQDAPLTREMFSAQLQRLIERARTAGLHPLQTMANTYVKRGVAIFESLLSALEYEDRPKKKKK